MAVLPPRATVACIQMSWSVQTASARCPLLLSCPISFRMPSKIARASNSVLVADQRQARIWECASDHPFWKRAQFLLWFPGLNFSCKKSRFHPNAPNTLRFPKNACILAAPSTGTKTNAWMIHHRPFCDRFSISIATPSTLL